MKRHTGIAVLVFVLLAAHAQAVFAVVVGLAVRLRGARRQQQKKSAGGECNTYHDLHYRYRLWSGAARGTGRSDGI